MGPRIYLDNHATTPLDPRVAQAMAPYANERFGNAASAHLYGWEAAEAVERAQTQVASLIGCNSKEVVLTSGATESNNLALIGAMEMYADRGRHLVTTNIEHPAVRDVAIHLATRGCEVTEVPVGRDGIVDPEAVIGALRDDTVLCSVMWANNEIGTLQPIEPIASACRERGILVHSDAAQAVGKVPIDGSAVDLLSLSAHKLYGPKGVGALMVRRRQPRVRLAPLMHGGGHQKGLRPGTLPVPLIVGMGEACALAVQEMTAETTRVARLRDRLVSRLTGEIEGTRLNGAAAPRLAGNANLRFHGVEAEALLLEAPGVAVSTGSACSSVDHEPSHVLLALGLSPEEAHSSLRFGVGRFSTDEEIDDAVDTLKQLVLQFQRTSPSHRAVGGGMG